MSRYLHNRDWPPSAIEHIQLQISGSYPDYVWSYSQPVVILGDTPTVFQINLQNNTVDQAIITTYASTGVSAKRSPIISFATSSDQKTAVLTMSLLAHQVVDFGVFVELTHKKHPKTILFCDPQASNDPIKNL